MKLPILRLTSSLLAGSIAIAFFYSSCSSDQVAGLKQEKYIIPPLDNINIPFTHYRFMAANGGEFTTPTGSKINIPKNAFTDSSGNSITGAIELSFREFHDAADIYVSGIPMAQKNGADNYLETAGMFEIRATSNNKTIEINPEKKITIAMASYVDDGCYNQFYFDENKNSWNLIADEYPEPNPEKLILHEELEKLKAPLAIPLPDNYFALNFYSAVDVMYDRGYKKFNDRKIKKQLNAYNLKWMDFYCSQTIKYKGKYMPASYLAWKNLSGKKFPSWIKNHTASFKQLYGNTYLISFKDSKTKQTFSFKAQAAMKLRNLFRKSANQWSKEYQDYVAKKIELEEKYAQAAEVYRFFDVSDFGIYNSDRFLKQENPIPVVVYFELDDVPANEEVMELNYITANNRSVIKFAYDTAGNHIGMSPGDRAIIFGIHPSTGETLLFSREDYNGIDFEALQQSVAKPSLKLKLKPLNKEFTSINDIRTMLEEGNAV